MSACSGDDPQRLPLAGAADHDRQVGLERGRLDPQVVERVAAAGRAGDLVAVEQVARDVAGGLRQPVEPLPEAGAEVDPEGAMLALEPGAAEAHDRAAAADVVDGRDAP